MPNLNRAFKHHGSSFTVPSITDHTWIMRVVPEVPPCDSSLERKAFPCSPCPVTIQSHQRGYHCRFARSRTPLSRDSDFWFPGARPNKWLILNRIIDLSDLRCQQISRKWETKERIALSSRARRHCLRNTIN